MEVDQAWYPLGLCRNLDDIDLDGSKFIEEAALFEWLDQLKIKVLIHSYEKIADKQKSSLFRGPGSLAAEKPFVPKF